MAAEGGDRAFWARARRRWVAAVGAAEPLRAWPPGLAALVVDHLDWPRTVPLRLGACSMNNSATAEPARRALWALDEGGEGPPRWVALAPLPAPAGAEPRFDAAVLRCSGGALLVTGGVTPSDNFATQAAVAAAARQRHVYRPDAGAWETRPAAAAAAGGGGDGRAGRLRGHAGAQVGAYVYLTGGISGVAGDHPAATASGERTLVAAAAQSASAESLPPMPGGPRAHHAALGLAADAPGDAGCGGRLFVFGGTGYRGHGGEDGGFDVGPDAQRLAAVACYDVARARWRVCAPMPRARSHACAAGPLADGRLVVLGGLDARGTPLDVVDVYDPREDAWRAAPPWRLPRPVGGGRLWPVQAEVARGGAALVVVADTTFSGPFGYSGASGSSSWLLDLATGAWTQLAEPVLAPPPPPPPAPPLGEGAAPHALA